MAEKKISEQLFEAMDVIIGKRLEAVQKDNTILCTVENDSKAENGEYTVSYSATKFTAYSDNTKYRIGQNVWVLVPNGDYNEKKIIIGKSVKNSDTPYVWIDPLDSYANMTGQVLRGSYDFTGNNGLIANYSAPRDIFTNAPVAGTTDGTEAHVSDTSFIENWVGVSGEGNLKWKTLKANAKNLAGYNRVGISAEFKTAFGFNPPVNGSYGLLFVLITQIESNTKQKGPEKYQDNLRYTPMFLDSSQMWGNPYNYADYYKQSICYDIDPAKHGTPVGIMAYFYQNFDFNDSTYPYNTDVMGEMVLVEPNIFVKNISVSFGYAVDKVDDDTVFLFTTNNDTYSVDNNNYEKTLQARFVYVGDDQTSFAINNFNDLNKYLAESSNFKDLAPMLRWYRYRLNEGVFDPRAGEFWEEFYPDYTSAASEGIHECIVDGLFSATVNNLKNEQDERFLCILCYNNKFAYYLRSYLIALQQEGKTADEKYAYYNKLWRWWYQIIGGWTDAVSQDVNSEFTKKFPFNTNVLNSSTNHITSEEVFAQWAASDELIKSDILVFTNEANAYDSSRDFVQALRVEPASADNGVFNIYDATYGANNLLVNSNDEHIARRLKASFWSAVTEQDEMDQVERLAWYIPRYHTMIKKPVKGKNYQTRQRITVTNETFKPNTFYVYTDGEYKTALSFSESATYYSEATKEEFFAEAADVDAYANTSGKVLSQEEIDLFKERLKSYYIILEDEITNNERIKQTKEAILTYYIKPELKKQWTNNTILASVYRYKRIYEGENAQFTPMFGAKGASGTDYTLSLTIIEETASSGKYYNPSAWTLNDTTYLTLEAHLYDANDQPIETGITYTWKLKGASGNGTAGSTYAVNSINTATGAIYECTVKLDAAINNTTTFIGYLSIPVRSNRKYIDMQGPTTIRYDASGTGAKYFDAPYGLLDITEEIEYNDNVNLVPEETLLSGETDVTNNFYPVVQKNKRDGLWYLKPKTMYFNDVNYKMHINIGNGLWINPILVLVDPYGNKFLNNWGGKLNIDYDSNTIMSAVMGAGKKNNDNTFTGLLLGDLPKTQTSKRTGLLGYESGEETYGIFDDGTMFLGKSNRAQLKFDGTNGYIKNAGYDYNNGIKIDFDGGITKTAVTSSATASVQAPSIDMKASDGSQVYISTNGTEINPYFKIKSANTGTTTGKDLIHIGNDGYYLQTNNYQTSSGNFAFNDGKTGSDSNYYNQHMSAFGGKTGHQLEQIYKNWTITQGGIGSHLNLSTGAFDISDLTLSATQNGVDTESELVTSNIMLRTDGRPFFAVQEIDRAVTDSSNPYYHKLKNLVKVAHDETYLASANFDTSKQTGFRVLIDSKYSTTSEPIKPGITAYDGFKITAKNSDGKRILLSTEQPNYPLAIGHTANTVTGIENAPFKVSWDGTITAAGDIHIAGNVDGTNDIAGWQILPNELRSPDAETHLYSSTQTDSTPVNGESKNTWRIRTSSNFGVDDEGKLYASNAVISGTITTSSGYIGGWEIGNDQIKNGNVHLYSGNQGQAMSVGGSDAKNNWRIRVGTKFGVDSDGNFYANAGKISAATITGSLTYDNMPFTKTTVNILTDVTPSYGTRSINIGVSDSGEYYTISLKSLTSLTFSRKTLTVLASATSTDLTKTITLTLSREYHGGGCFAKGTKILMYDYSYKNIEDLRVGDKVISYDINSNKLVTGIISKTYVHHHTPAMNKLIFINGQELVLTPGHPVWTAQGWKSLDIKNSLKEHGVYASLLQIGDYVINKQQQQVQIVDIQKIIIDNNYDSYNAEVDKYHTFIANGIIAHNIKVPADPV